MQILAVTWDINPEIVSFHGVTLRWYGLLFALSFYFAFIILSKMFRAENRSVRLVDKMILYVGIGTLIGARLGHCFLYQPDYFIDHPLEILMIWKGGLASHGSAVGILVGLAFYSYRTKLSYLWVLDRVVITVALAGALIRIGNFMNSEIAGDPSTLPCAVTFVQLDSIPRHPSQLYEAIVCFIALFVLGYSYLKTKLIEREGLLLSIFLILIFGSRFFLEYTKNEIVNHENVKWLTMGQWLCIPFIITGCVLMIIVLSKKKLQGSYFESFPKTTKGD